MTPTLTGYWPSQLPAEPWNLEWGAASLQKLQQLNLPVIHRLPKGIRSEFSNRDGQRRYRVYCTLCGRDVLMVLEPRCDRSGYWDSMQVITVERDEYRPEEPGGFEIKDLF